MKSTPLVWLQLSWPREVTDVQMLAAWRRLPGLAGWPLIIEAIGRGGSVQHRIAVQASREKVVTRQLRAELPGIGIEADGTKPLSQLQAACDIRLTTRRRAVTTADLPSASRAILTTLSMAGRSEVVVLQWVLGHPLHPQSTPSGGAPLQSESWLGLAAQAVLNADHPTDSEPVRALAAKQGEPGWRALGRLAARAATVERRATLMRQVAGAIRSLETPGLRVVIRRRRPTATQHASIPWIWPLRLNATEMAALSGWPIGDTRELPVDALTSRPMAASREIPRKGRVVAESSFPGAERPLALSTAASLRHAHLLGPSGTGKSTMLLNLIAQDIKAGHGVVVIEPRGDLVADCLAQVPAGRVNDVVLLDPLDAERPVGLNPLAPMGRSPELAADQLLSTFHDLYAAHWGPRTQDILSAALLTLAQVPDMTLVAIPVLLTNNGFRRRVVSRINDPVGLGPFWAGFEAWSEGERSNAIAPVLNKLRPFLMRPALRLMLGQAEPRFDLRQVFQGQKILLVNLAKGQLGPETAALLGSLIVGQLWQAALGRSNVAADHRRPVFLFIDEFQEYLRLPVDLADALAQARGLGLSLTMAHQHLAQLSTDVRSAIAANAQSKVAFRLAPDDARVMASGGRLAPEDFSGLGAYECYVQLVANDAVQPWASGRSLPPPEVISDVEVVRAASRRNYGVDRAVVDDAIAALINGARRTGEDSDDLAPRRRGGQP